MLANHPRCRISTPSPLAYEPLLRRGNWGFSGRNHPETAHGINDICITPIIRAHFEISGRMKHSADVTKLLPGAAFRSKTPLNQRESPIRRLGGRTIHVPQESSRVLTRTGRSLWSCAATLSLANATTPYDLVAQGCLVLALAVQEPVPCSHSRISSTFGSALDTPGWRAINPTRYPTFRTPLPAAVRLPMPMSAPSPARRHPASCVLLRPCRTMRPAKRPS